MERRKKMEKGTRALGSRLHSYIVQRVLCFLRKEPLSEGDRQSSQPETTLRLPPVLQDSHPADCSYRHNMKKSLLGMIMTHSNASWIHAKCNHPSISRRGGLFINLLCLLALTFATISDSRSQSCSWYVQRKPDSRIYPSIFFADTLHGWVGRFPLVRDGMLRTSDGGKTWDTVNFPIDIGVVGSISFVDSMIGWCIVPSLSTLYKSSDGGLTWTECYSGWYYKLVPGVMQFLDTLHGYAVGPDTTYNVTRTWRTIDGGRTWSSNTIPNYDVSSYIQFIDQLTGWIAGLGIFKTTDGGVSWMKQTYDSATVGWGRGGIYFVDSLHGWSCSKGNGWIIRTTDGGESWVNQFDINQPNGIGTSAISFSDELNGWIFGSTFYQGDVMELIYRTTDGGDSWFEESIGLSRYLGGGVAKAPCHAWAISAGDGSILGHDMITSVTEPELALPETIQLSQNYPNPYNPSTKITYQLPHRDHVQLKVFDSVGREVETLVDRTQEAGEYTVRFDASAYSSGLYYFHLITPSSRHVKKSLFLK